MDNRNPNRESRKETLANLVSGMVFVGGAGMIYSEITKGNHNPLSGLIMVGLGYTMLGLASAYFYFSS